MSGKRINCSRRTQCAARPIVDDDAIVATFIARRFGEGFTVAAAEDVRVAREYRAQPGWLLNDLQDGWRGRSYRRTRKGGSQTEVIVVNGNASVVPQRALRRWTTD